MQVMTGSAKGPARDSQAPHMLPVSPASLRRTSQRRGPGPARPQVGAPVPELTRSPEPQRATSHPPR